MIAGADSNVLFERLGRVLHRAGTLDRDSSRHVVTCEEQRGLSAAIKLLPADAVQWGLEKRTWEIGTALFFMAGAHFLFVDGQPALGDVPLLSVPPMELAIEGVRRYDEWRNKSETKPPDMTGHCCTPQATKSCPRMAATRSRASLGGGSEKIRVRDGALAAVSRIACVWNGCDARKSFQSCTDRSEIDGAAVACATSSCMSVSRAAAPRERLELCREKLT
jgi:hypothetical protein